MTEFAVMSANVVGRGGLGEAHPNNNFSEASALILRNTLFVLVANELIHNQKAKLFGNDIRIKDSVTGREFTFSITGSEVK